ncbi:MAG: hypothetical protein RL341_1087 [Pseudomonadota bacterium]|jgi:hypothetical protein
MRWWFLFMAVTVALQLHDARADTGVDQQGAAPANPFAADSPWPQFHRNGYAQAATPLRGPEVGDQLEAQYVALPSAFARGGAPTQMHLSERYPDGSRTAWSTNLTGIVKAHIAGDRFTFAGGYVITPRVMDWNIHWNMQLGRGNKAFVPSTKERAILRFGERDPRNPYSEIVLEEKFVLPEQIKGSATVINLSFDGWLIFVTNEAWVGAVKTDFSQWRAFDLGRATGDVTVHNSFPVDESGNLFVVSYYAMTKLHWTGNGFTLLWRSPYDFRGPGCGEPSKYPSREVLKVVKGSSCTGSGTTPTLVGRGGMDKLVVVVDSHRQNNLVAFWRDEIPAHWQGVPGQDRRVAAVMPLPYATWEGAGFTVENSPPVAGYDIAVAQYSGFSPGCGSLRGVQMARWDATARRMQLAWVNPEVQFNNVMTISTASNLIYGIGRGDDCRNVYRGLDRATGQVAFSLPLDASRDYVDGGNSHVVNDDRSIVFGTATGMVRIRVK